MLFGFGQLICHHGFEIDDLHQTGIEQLAPPTGNDFHAWREYFSQRYTHDSHTKRVAWPCAKCGKVFYAHCGLDISPEHGPTIRRPEKNYSAFVSKNRTGKSLPCGETSPR